MKKSLIIIALVCGLGWTAQAQLTSRIWGGGISYGPNTEKLGLNIRTYSYYRSNLRLGAELNIYAPYHHPNQVPITDYLADAIVNAHYLMPASSKLTFYPLGGIHIKYGVTQNRILPANEVNTFTLITGLNIGAGLQYKLSEKAYLFGECKYSTSREFNRSVPTLGVMIHTASK